METKFTKIIIALVLLVLGVAAAFSYTLKHVSAELRSLQREIEHTIALEASDISFCTYTVTEASCGPEAHIYSSETTDEAKLNDLVARYNETFRKLSGFWDIMSSKSECRENAMTLPPAVNLLNGECTPI